MSKNYGLNIRKEIEEQSDSDWKFGSASIPDLVKIPENERINYFPKGELQKGAEDFMDCATRGPHNIAEYKINYLIRKGLLKQETINWLKDNYYINSNNEFESSDAFTAIRSGTTRQGNSMKAPLRSMENDGLVPKKLLPAEPWMTWNDYHDPKRITQKLIDLGLEFRKRIRINYQKVYSSEYRDLIKEDVLNVAGYAWAFPENGVYPRVDGIPPNHVWVNFAGYWMAFDNYQDSFDGDFVKNLAPNYDFLDYGYRITVNEEEVIPRDYLFWKRLWLSFARHLGL